MNFFFDRCLPRPVARMLEQFDQVNNVRHQDDDPRFSADSEDVEIIQTLASDDPKPVWLTADLAQKRNPVERAALRESGLTIFFLRARSKKGLSPHFQALKTLAVWPRIVEYAMVRRPMAFEVPFGRISQQQIIDKIITLGPTRQLF